LTVLTALLAAGLLLSTSTAVTSRQSEQAAPDGPSRLRIAALGDSVTAGTRCDCSAFPELYAKLLGDRYGSGTRVDNRGVPGATSRDLVNDLGTEEVASSVQTADIVLITIGANDFGETADAVLSQTCGDADDLACARSGLTALGHNLDAIVERTRGLRRGEPTAILVTGYWNVYEDGDVADHDYATEGRLESDRLTLAVNEVLRGRARQDGATYVDLTTPFRGPDGTWNPSDLLASDGDHPNAAGHRLIAKTLLAAGTAPLRPPR
jgi:lysophospholipase L1-like esterase